MIDTEQLQARMKGIRHFTAQEYLRLRRDRDWTELPEEFLPATLRVLRAADQLRELHGSPVIVGNGYRPSGYNARVGGAKNSAHIRGAAMDLDPIKAERDFAVLCARAWLGTDWLRGIGIYAGRVHIDVAHPGSAGKRAWPARWNPASLCARTLRAAKRAGPITLTEGVPHDAV